MENVIMLYQAGIGYVYFQIDALCERSYTIPIALRRS